MSSQFYKLKVYTKKDASAKSGSGNSPETSWVLVSSPSKADVTDEKTKERTVVNAIPMGEAFMDVQLMLTKLEYDKTLFAPCSAVAEITVDRGRTERSSVIDALKNCFKEKSVDIILSDKDGAAADASDFFIGKDFIIFGAQPFYKSDDTAFIVKLNLFSRDKLLTLNKFSRCYLNRRLGQDILAGSLSSNGMLGKCNVGCNASVSRLQQLSYEYKAASGSSKAKKDEQIQPYRVQYNEDFHSFVSRIACTCGEFLFFEDGKLNLGLPAHRSGAEKKLEDGKQILSIEYPQMFESPLTVQSFYNEYHKEKSEKKSADAGSEEEDALVFNEEGAFDEYFDVFDSNVKPDSVGKETLWGPYIKTVITGICPALFSDAKNQRKWLATDGLVRAGMDIGEAALLATTSSAYVNDQFNKRVFAKPGDNTESFKESLQKDGTKLSQFASVKGFEKLMSARITEIREQEKKAASDIVRLSIKAGTDCRISLGDYVRLNDDATVYVVTGVSGSSQVRKTKERGSTAEIFSLEDSQEVEIVPMEGGSYYPPYNSCAESARVSPQTAIVADSDDPRYLGRVRLKYPWQPDGDKASPWVRFVAPMASKNGATAHFKLFKGDEVMVDYQGGNIERPYVVGALFNSEAKPDSYLYTPWDRTIRSQTGEVIDFKAGTYDKYMSDLIPAWGAISNFLPWITKSLTSALDSLKVSDIQNKFHGSVTLSDTFGLWTIKGDTAGREITLDSMAGKIRINALTGISISTNGDLNVSAKNINIKAGNNIDIESGVEIRNERAKEKTKGLDGTKDIACEVAKGLLTDIVAGKVDFTILRTIAEIICPPMEGTLRIKSNRYLNLEAGEGRSFDVDASDPKNSFVSKADRERLQDTAEDLNALGTQIADDIKKIRNFCNGYIDVGFLHGSLSSLSGKYNALKASQKKAKEKCDIKDLIEAADDGKQAKNIECLGDKSKLEKACKDAALAFYEECLAFFGALDKKSGELGGSGFKKLYPGDANLFVNSVNDWYDQLKTEENIKTLPDKDNLVKNAKAFRRAQYRGYVDKILINSNFSSLKTAINDEEWEEAVRGLYVKEASLTKGLATMIADKFRKNGWSFVDYDKFGSEYYIKNPTAKGRILFSQESGRTYHIQKDGTLHPSPINETLRNIQRALMEDDNFDTVD